ncbi:hypothetical protein MASR1M68_06280 [Elusimicrobiota bacterium]
MNRKKIEQTKMSQNEFCKDGNYRHNANLYCGVYGWHAYSSGYFECANLIANNLLFEDFISDKYTCSSNKDTNVFPMFFLYRHYIELSLKSALKRINKLLENECNYKNDISHDIESLFTKFVNSYDSYLKDEFIGLKDDKELKQLLLLDFKKQLSKFLKNIYKNDTSHDIESLFTKFINSYDLFLKDKSIGLKDHKESKELLLDFRKQQNIFKDINDLDKGSISVRYPIDRDNNYFFSNDGFLNIKKLFDKMQEIHELFKKLSELLTYLEDI